MLLAEVEFMGRVVDQKLLLFLVILLVAIILVWYLFGRKKGTDDTPKA